jgi:hypothetical protein
MLKMENVYRNTTLETLTFFETKIATSQEQRRRLSVDVLKISTYQVKRRKTFTFSFIQEYLSSHVISSPPLIA